MQYADIDHMDERKDFTVDPDNFDGLNDYFKSLQQDGMHIIIILVRHICFIGTCIAQVYVPCLLLPRRV